MAKPEQKSTFFGGAAVLAAGIVIVKLIGAIYKIPLFNIIGDEGTGHFNNAYVIYNLIQMVSTAGLPVALSKAISEANTQGRRNQVHRTFNVALVTFLILGAISFAVMFCFAGPLAQWQGDSLADVAVMAMAPTCLLVCGISAFRGYAQGHANMVPTSVSQIIEATGKLVVGLALAWILVQQGFRSEYSAAGAIFGVTAGAGLALGFLIVEHIRRRARENPTLDDRADPHIVILKRLFAVAVPITIGASIVPITSWLDTAQVQNILRETMGAESAQWYQDTNQVDPVVSAYGVYQKAMTVYNLPSSFMVAITASIIPAISACRARRDDVGASKIAESSLRIGAMLALPAGVGLAVLSGPIMLLLYSDTDHTIAAPAMMFLGLASVFVCVMLLCNAILQASGFVNLPIFVMLLGCIAKLGVNYVTVHLMGIIGAPIGTLSCYAIVALAELYLIKRVLPAAPSYWGVFFKPAIATAVMGGAAWAAHGFLVGVLGNSLATLGGIAVGGCVYLVLIVALKAISKDDLALMPKGDKIAKLLRL